MISIIKKITTAVLAISVIACPSISDRAYALSQEQDTEQAQSQSLIEVLEFLNIKIDFEVMEVLITLLISSTFFTSTVTLCFVWLKSTFPKLKGSLFFGAIIWYFTISFFIGILSSLDVDSIWVLNFIELLIIGLSYFGTVHLIENKLEIYN